MYENTAAHSQWNMSAIPVNLMCRNKQYINKISDIQFTSVYLPKLTKGNTCIEKY